MKRRTLQVVAAILALAVMACSLSGGSADQESAPSAPESEGGAASESGQAEVPIYPGADQIAEETELPEEYKTNYEKASTQSYTVQADLEEVASFYKEEMPKYGWENIMHIPMGGTSYTSVWQQGNGENGATISIGEWEDGLIHIGIMTAEGLK